MRRLEEGIGMWNFSHACAQLSLLYRILRSTVVSSFNSYHIIAIQTLEHESYLAEGLSAGHERTCAQSWLQGPKGSECSQEGIRGYKDHNFVYPFDWNREIHNKVENSHFDAINDDANLKSIIFYQETDRKWYSRTSVLVTFCSQLRKVNSKI